VRVAHGEVYDRVKTAQLHKSIREQSGRRSGGTNEASDMPPPATRPDLPAHEDPAIQNKLREIHKRDNG
jgi:hypothetical protein